MTFFFVLALTAFAQEELDSWDTILLSRSTPYSEPTYPAYEEPEATTPNYYGGLSLGGLGGYNNGQPTYGFTAPAGDDGYGFGFGGLGAPTAPSFPGYGGYSGFGDPGLSDYSGQIYNPQDPNEGDAISTASGTAPAATKVDGDEGLAAAPKAFNIKDLTEGESSAPEMCLAEPKYSFTQRTPAGNDSSEEPAEGDSSGRQ